MGKDFKKYLEFKKWFSDSFLQTVRVVIAMTILSHCYMVFSLPEPVLFDQLLMLLNSTFEISQSFS